jgi:hypothetical protein
MLLVGCGGTTHLDTGGATETGGRDATTGGADAAGGVGRETGGRTPNAGGTTTRPPTGTGGNPYDNLVCEPGTSLECVRGCVGRYVCRRDGSGYEGDCTCGTAGTPNFGGAPGAAGTSSGTGGVRVVCEPGAHVECSAAQGCHGPGYDCRDGIVWDGKCTCDGTSGGAAGATGVVAGAGGAGGAGIPAGGAGGDPVNGSDGGASSGAGGLAGSDGGGSSRTAGVSGAGGEGD